MVEQAQAHRSQQLPASAVSVFQMSWSKSCQQCRRNGQLRQRMFAPAAARERDSRRLRTTRQESVFWRAHWMQWEPGERGVAELPSGRLVRGRRWSARTTTPAEHGLYALWHDPNPPWPYTWLKWPDFGLPLSREVAWAEIERAWRLAEVERGRWPAVADGAIRGLLWLLWPYWTGSRQMQLSLGCGMCTTLAPSSPPGNAGGYAGIENRTRTITPRSAACPCDGRWCVPSLSRMLAWTLDWKC